MAERSELRVRLRRPLRAALEAGHPWVYRDVLEPIDAEPGTLAKVLDERGPIAVGYVDRGPIALRVLALGAARIDQRFFEGRLARAASLRQRVIPAETDAYRLVHGEGDGLPGVVIDLYSGWAVVQFDGPGAEALREPIVRALVATMPGLEGVLARTGRREQKRIELAHGREPPEPLEVRERGMRLRADLRHGQKTGLFLDHRESRARVRAIARGLSVLNLYGYTGGFSIAAGLGGATEVDTVDVAPAALELASASWELNGLPAAQHHTHARDVPEMLEEARAAGRRWGLVIADPPSFAPNEAAVPGALKSYRALHRACLRAVVPGGLYLAASCSSHVDRAAFDRTLKEGAEKIGPVQILERWGAPADHPRLSAFPEGDYLKVVLARRLD